MAMPRQLAQARRPKRSSRPIAELLPCLNANELVHSFPNDGFAFHHLDDIGFRWPRLRHLSISRGEIQVTHLSGHVQSIGVNGSALASANIAPPSSASAAAP
jgi:hypothetical protein